VRIFAPYGGSLNNAAETLLLTRPDGPPAHEPTFAPRLIADEVRYEQAEPWPVAVDGNSLTRQQPDAWGNDPASWAAAAPTPGEVPWAVQPVPAVVGRYVFYNRSSFDGNNAAATPADDGAIAPDKQALRPGEAATFANYTSYSSGLNGIMVDVAHSEGPITADDFDFRVGNALDPVNFTDAPAPNGVTVRPGAGVGGSDRVTIVFEDHAIRGKWLEVTVAAGNIGLAAPDVFYFGNAVAEAGNTPGNTQVTTTDLLLARNNPRNFLNPAAIDFAFDYNRDQRVNSTDVLLARNNQTNFLSALRLIDLSAGEAERPDEKTVDEVLAMYQS